MKSTPQMQSPRSKFLPNYTKHEYNLPVLPNFTKNRNMTHNKKPFIKGNQSDKLNTIDSATLNGKSSYINTIKDLTGNI